MGTKTKSRDRKDVGSVEGDMVGNRLVVKERYRGIDKPKGKAREKVDLELLTFQVRRLANELEGLGVKLKGISLISGEEVQLLLGELRAVRHLLDKKAEFIHLDVDRARLPKPDPDPHAFSSRCPYCGMGMSTDARPATCKSCGRVITELSR